MTYRGIFEYEYPVEHKEPVGIDVYLHGDCVKGKIIEWEYKALEQEPRKGHWIEEFIDTEGEVRFTCSSCGKYQLFGTDFCYNCGSDNREVEE